MFFTKFIMKVILQMSSLDEDFKQKLKAIPSDNKKQINFLPILRYAAIVALVLVVSILASISFLDKKFNNNEKLH